MISPDQNGKRSILSVMSRLRRGVAFMYVFVVGLFILQDKGCFAGRTKDNEGRE
jgi:hypothetical protein